MLSLTQVDYGPISAIVTCYSSVFVFESNIPALVTHIMPSPTAIRAANCVSNKQSKPDLDNLVRFKAAARRHYFVEVKKPLPSGLRTSS